MATDENHTPVSFMQVTSLPDGSVRLFLDLAPNPTASNLFDAAYAVLDELSGVNAIDPDEGKPPKKEAVQ
jgi:hypothetical protein